jgi:hypothetical protein
VAPVVKLEDSSDDDLYRPTPPRFGDAGQVSSRWSPGQSSQQAPPQDDGGESSDDDGGDYMRFYRNSACRTRVFSLGLGRIQIYYEFGLYM